MSTQSLFKWRHFLPEVILLNVRWYCRYALSYRDLEEMMRERGVEVDHSTLNRWVLKYAPELDKRIRPHLQSTNDSWRVDETYIKVKGEWKYLYRAVDSAVVSQKKIIDKRSISFALRLRNHSEDFSNKLCLTHTVPLGNCVYLSFTHHIDCLKTF